MVTCFLYPDPCLGSNCNWELSGEYVEIHVDHLLERAE